MDKIIITTPSELETLITDSVRKVFSEQNSNSQPELNTQLLSAEQACAYLNLAKQTLYGFTSKQEIPFLKKGKKLYFKQTELEAWVNAGKHKSADELNQK
jgi:excisionase family DNA binding protein